MCLLQLWINATFEPSLEVTIPSDLTRQTEKRRVKSTRLVLLTPVDTDCSSEKTFKNHLVMYVGRVTFVSSMVPFVSRHGLDWFKIKFMPLSSEHHSEALDIGETFLKPIILSTKISTGKASLGLVINQPNLVAR